MAEERGLTAHFRRHGYVHAAWTIFLLILVIVSFVVITPSADSLMGFVSFAATVTSLFLAAIAIFYSMISNQGFSETIGSLRSSADNVQVAAKNIADTSNSLSSQSERLIEQVSLVPASVTKLSEELSQRMEAYASPDTIPTSGLSTPGTAPNYAAALCMYSLALADQNKKDLDTSQIKTNSDEYFGGIMMGFFLQLKCFHHAELSLMRSALIFVFSHSAI